MGLSSSTLHQPATLSEKLQNLDLASPPTRSAASLLASLSGKAPATATITPTNIATWQTEFDKDPKNKLASTVLSKSDFTQALVSRKAKIADPQVFNVTLSSENKPANQKSSGRCWLFATTNVIRLAMSRKYGLGEDFELSQSYLYFYDALSKANWFLEQMLDLAETPLDDRTIQFLMEAPENDGGQFAMAQAVVETFGIVPQAVYPESFSSSATGKLNTFLTSKLREYALELRDLHKAAMRSLEEVEGKSLQEKKAIAVQSARKRKEELMSEVYRILSITLGTPPKADEEFTWEFYAGKDKQYKKVVTTPLAFYKDYGAVDILKNVSLIHDPRNPPGLYTVDRLGNVWGAAPVLYVNTSIEELKKAAIRSLKADQLTWFGCDVGKSSNSTIGIMDTEVYDTNEAFSTRINLTKAQRLDTGDSAMTHAMCLSAVHLDESGNSVRWRVENSWGVDACDKGYMLMTDSWFNEYVFQIVASRTYLSKELLKVLEGEPTVLPPWDPMGALA